MLHDAGMEALGLDINFAAIRGKPGVADFGIARDIAAEPRHRKAAFPSPIHLVGKRLNNRVHQGQQRKAVSAHTFILDIAAGRHSEQDEPSRDMDLRCCETKAFGIGHRLQHVFDQLRHLRRRRIFDFQRPRA